MIRIKIESLMMGLSLRVMFQDEARFGRIDDPSHCWAQPGMRPKANKQIVREYTYLYGAFSPQDGRMDSFILPHMDSFILPHMDSFCMNHFLKEVAKRYPKDLILMVTDGAPCHKGQELTIPHNIRLLFLPPYCPQLNPSENMWDEMREKYFGNVSFPSMDELEQHLIEACLHYEKHPETIKSITSWEWMKLNSV